MSQALCALRRVRTEGWPSGLRRPVSNTILGRDSREVGRGFGDPAKGGGGGRSEALHRMVYRATRLSTSYSFRRRRKELGRKGVLREARRLIGSVEGWPSGLRRRS
jgi:hypothetical protein